MEKHIEDSLTMAENFYDKAPDVIMEKSNKYLQRIRKKFKSLENPAILEVEADAEGRSIRLAALRNTVTTLEAAGYEVEFIEGEPEFPMARPDIINAWLPGTNPNKKVEVEEKSKKSSWGKFLGAFFN
jgi:hypothetical protein